MSKNVLNEVQRRRVTGMLCVRACARTPPPLTARFVSLAKLLCSFPECVVFGICREGLENSVFYHYHPSMVTDLRYLVSEYVSFLFL